MIWAFSHTKAFKVCGTKSHFEQKERGDSPKTAKVGTTMREFPQSSIKFSLSGVILSSISLGRRKSYSGKERMESSVMRKASRSGWAFRKAPAASGPMTMK